MNAQRLGRIQLLQELNKIDTKIQVVLEKAQVAGSWHKYYDEYMALCDETYAIEKRIDALC